MNKRNRRNNIKISSDFKKQPKTKMATQSQIKQIGDFKEDFQSQIKDFSTSLRKDIEQVEMLNKISASTGMYQPQLAESITQRINFNPRMASSADIEKWLTNPQYYESYIRGFSQYLEYNVGQYHRAMWYFNTIKSFNYQLLPADGNNEKNVTGTEYKNSMNTSLNACAKMNIKNKFPMMDLLTLQEGATFWWIDEYNESFEFLQLPTDWCYITGTWNHGWTGCINLAYFDQMRGVEKCIPELSTAYNHFLEVRSKGLTGDKLAPFQFYPLPLNKSWIFTCDPNKALKVPIMASAMGASLDVLSYRQLLKDQSMLDLWKILAFKMPLDKDNKLTMSYDFASDIIDSIQRMLPENIATFVTPFDVDPVSSSQVTTLDKVVDLGDKNVYSALGVQSNLFGQETKSAKAFSLGMQIDFAYASTHMYAQFNNMVNWILYQKSKTFRWAVRFEGNSLEKDAEIKSAVQLVTGANYPISYLVAKTGYEPHEFYNLVRLENSLGIKDKMKPLVSAFQQSGKTGKDNPLKEAGRPNQGDDVGDAGEKSRQYKE